MDRDQHQRFLTYLKKFEYFGRSRARLDATEFVALEAELADLKQDGPETIERRRTIRTLLLKD